MMKVPDNGQLLNILLQITSACVCLSSMCTPEAVHSSLPLTCFVGIQVFSHFRKTLCFLRANLAILPKQEEFCDRLFRAQGLWESPL